MNVTFHVCVVCGGCGTVPPGFYSRMVSATSTERETCRGCSGRGYMIRRPMHESDLSDGMPSA